MKNLKLFLVGTCILAAWGCGTTAPVNNTATTNANAARPNAATSPAATPVVELAMGRELYKQNCAVCHKEDGTGGKITIEGKSIEPDDLTSEKIKKFSDEKISGYIVNGVVDEGMPAFKDKLTEAQIKEVVAHVRKEIQKMPAAAASPSM
jgi:mono/diheme cytochrome c family protein